MSGHPGQPSGRYKRTAAHREALTKGAVRSWQDPEKRARRIAGMTKAWDDPLYLAVRRKNK